MFYEQESAVVLPVNRPASNKVLLSAVTPEPLTLPNSGFKCREATLGTGAARIRESDPEIQTREIVFVGPFE